MESTAPNRPRQATNVYPSPSAFADVYERRGRQRMGDVHVVPAHRRHRRLRDIRSERADVR